MTYARYVVTVGTDGSLPVHSGLAPGQPSAAFNGVQFRPLVAGADGGMQPIDAPSADGSSGGGGNDSPDGGMIATPHTGGCAVGGDRLAPALLVLGLVVRRRRRP